ncbi:MAG: DM13 domain-containing protein [Anaerolineae bacterium]
MRGPRWSVLFLGAIIVALLFSYPLWRGLLSSRSLQRPFALASEAQREVLLKEDNRDMAATAYVAMLTPVPAPTGIATLPGIDASLSGSFTEIDAVHRATGSVRIYRLSEDRLILRLENGFEVTNAPGLAIYLSGAEAPKSIAELTTSSVTAYPVGSLVGSTGDQQFDIPAQLRLERYRTVVIVSEPLNKIYSIAPIS